MKARVIGSKPKIFSPEVRPGSSKRAYGFRVEDEARTYLEAQGLRFLEARFLVRVGEIDLIFLDARELVFVEVRARTSRSLQSARESVDGKKLRRIRLAVQIYLQRRSREIANLDVRSLRLDVLGFDGHEFSWWKNQEF